MHVDTVHIVPLLALIEWNQIVQYHLHEVYSFTK